MLSQETAVQIPQIQNWPIDRLVEYPRIPFQISLWVSISGVGFTSRFDFRR
jgi:hypothetical protein